MLLTEGYDEPSIDCVVCLRPTQVRALYSQIVGRGTRLYPGKDHLLLLDFLWMSEEHNLVKPANLIASDPEEANAITAALGFEGDLEEAKGKADADRAATLRQRLKQNARRASRTFDAVEFALSLGEVELADFVPTMGWHGDPATAEAEGHPQQVRRRSRHHHLQGPGGRVARQAFPPPRSRPRQRAPGALAAQARPSHAGTGDL